MKFLAWHRRRARLVLLCALLAVWGCVLWSMGWTASDQFDARAASVGTAASRDKQPPPATAPGAIRSENAR